MEFFALDTASGDVDWMSEEAGLRINSSPTVADGIVYVGDTRGYLHAFDADSGDHRWRYETANAVNSSPFVAEETVYFGSNDGHVYALER